MTEVPRNRVARTARLAALPLGYAGRTAVGLGKRILLAQKFLHTEQIFAYLIVLGVIGFAIDLLFRWLLRVSCRWSFD